MSQRKKTQTTNTDQAKTKLENQQDHFVISEVLGRMRGLEDEMASVLKEMEEKVEQLEQLNGFSSLLNSTLDEAIVREKALEATCRLLKCETASLYLVDPQKAELYWETALGSAGKELQKTVRLPIDDRSIAGYVAMYGESVILNDVEGDPRHFKANRSNSDFKTKTMICVPLKAKDRTIGVLQALNKLQTIPPRPSRHSWPDFYESDKRILENLGHQVATAIENSQLYTNIKKNFFETCEALAEAIEKKDRYTGGHTKRVVHYSLCIAQKMQLSAEQLERLRLSAILHDVGKIGIEDLILKKAAALTPEEWTIMRSHPEFGYEIMGRVEGLRDVIGGVRYHHERWDGTGYPLGLKGEEIPLLARIISVADTYDAMTSTRPYRNGLAHEVACAEIFKYKNSQFDPEIVDSFVEVFAKEAPKQKVPIAS